MNKKKMNKKKVFSFLVVMSLTLIILLESVMLYTFWQKSSDEALYQRTAEMLLKSSGWKITEEILAGEMELDGFGEWEVSKDTEFNIPGFEDNISDEFYEELGSWNVKNKNARIYTFSYEVVDTTGILPEDLSLIVNIAYYEDQVSMARVYINLYELVGEKAMDNNEIVFDRILSWPITVDRDIIRETAEYYVNQIE